MTRFDQIVVYLGTIGGGLEEGVCKLMRKGDFLSGLILDAIGSEATERATGSLQELIKRAQEEGERSNFPPL